MLKVVDAPVWNANKDVVEKLEGLLEEARRGEVEGLVFVSVSPTKWYKTGIWGQMDTLPTLGAIITLQDGVLGRANQKIEEESPHFSDPTS